jgi:hypothetical protein
MLKKPILFLVFNRPESTRITFDRIRQAAPTKLYVAADGPRAHVAAEVEKCREVRQLIANGINWPCEVSYLYRENNLGCGKAVYMCGVGPVGEGHGNIMTRICVNMKCSKEPIL